jgi:SAM-dependent methyltransferase
MQRDYVARRIVATESRNLSMAGRAGIKTFGLTLLGHSLSQYRKNASASIANLSMAEVIRALMNAHTMNRFHHWYCRSSVWKRRIETELMPWALNGATLLEPALEIGPGPGITTEYLRARVQSLTALERDAVLANHLGQRFRRTNVRVIEGDATAMPFENGSFRGVFCFTMLHHVPSAALQDRLVAEAFRVLAPGGVFLGTDSRMSLRMKLFHWFDTMVIVDPQTFPMRLRRAGFTGGRVELSESAFRFCARR